MKIRLSNAGKRFNREWIFRKADLEFQSGNAYALTGPNGSGKSTLLQCIGSMLQLSEGQLQYEGGSFRNNHSQPATGPLANESAYRDVSFCAPYMDVIEEMTLIEFLSFHRQFKPFLDGMEIENIISLLGLQHSADKQLRNYSSGMKQRVKLAQAILSDTGVILLDEPCTNLDAAGIGLYHDLIRTYCMDRLVIVSSNDEVEYRFCEKRIDIQSYK